jgi:hypothetical protein
MTTLRLYEKKTQFMPVGRGQPGAEAREATWKFIVLPVDLNSDLNARTI